MNVSKLLQQAGKYLGAADPTAADSILKRVLKKNPANIDVLHLVGLTA